MRGELPVRLVQDDAGFDHADRHLPVVRATAAGVEPHLAVHRRPQGGLQGGGIQR
jgi:hypothetical protein